MVASNVEAVADGPVGVTTGFLVAVIVGTVIVAETLTLLAVALVLLVVIMDGLFATVVASTAIGV